MTRIPRVRHVPFLDVTDRERSAWRDRTVEWFSARNLVVGALGAVAGPVVAACLPMSNGWAKAGLVVTGSLLALLGFAIPAARSRLADQRAEEADDEAQVAGTTMRLAMSHVLLPALSYVVSGLDPKNREASDAVVAEAVVMVLSSAVSLCERGGQSRVRACWYRADVSDKEVVFKPKRHLGRGVQPSTCFSSNDARGAALARLVINDETELYEDLDTSKPKDWKTGGTSYRTFMVVPVRTNNRMFGLLTVDADEPGALTEADVLVVKVLAWVLALALSHCTPSVIASAGRRVPARPSA